MLARREAPGDGGGMLVQRTTAALKSRESTPTTRLTNVFKARRRPANFPRAEAPFTSDALRGMDERCWPHLTGEAWPENRPIDDFCFLFAWSICSSEVSVRACVVSFVGASGIRHSVDVTAETLYEAAALALSVFRQSDWADNIAPGTELDVTVRAPEATHSVTVNQIRRWCDGVAVSPDEVLKRNRVRALIG